MKPVKMIYRGAGLAIFLAYAGAALPVATEVYDNTKDVATVIYSDVQTFMNHSLQNARRFR